MNFFNGLPFFFAQKFTPFFSPYFLVISRAYERISSSQKPWYFVGLFYFIELDRKTFKIRNWQCLKSCKKSTIKLFQKFTLIYGNCFFFIPSAFNPSLIKSLISLRMAKVRGWVGEGEGSKMDGKFQRFRYQQLNWIITGSRIASRTLLDAKLVSI